MSIILIATNDTQVASVMIGTIEAIGHTPLTVSTTENIVEDVVLNEAAMVLVAEDLEPYSGWDVCELLRNDPGVPSELPVLMLVRGPGNLRKLEKFGFSGTLDPGRSSAEVGDALQRYLGEAAVPEGLDPLAELELD
jgi:hypothetical protein